MSEKTKLLLAFGALLAVGFIALNLMLFSELRKGIEESAYYKAYSHYLLYSMNPSHRGDENFVVSEQVPSGFAFHFRDPRDQFKSVYVVVRKNYFAESIKQSVKKILILQFLLIFSLLILYQMVLESLWKKVEDSKEFNKALVQSIAHKLGNFLSVQKANLSLLRKGQSPQTLDRLQKSVEKLEKDLSLTLRLCEKEESPIRVWINLGEVMRGLVKFFEEELKEKHFSLKLKEDIYVLADQRELEDILYNLLSNAVKYSKSFIHVRATVYKKKLLLTFRNDLSGYESRGMGLGLKLLEKHVERMEGKLVIRIKKHYSLHVCFDRFKI
ncbi:sensor histidine kinase [Thermocrinis sp.]